MRSLLALALLAPALCTVRAGGADHAARVALAGDVMLARGLAGTAREPGAVFGEVAAWTRGADLALANLESPFTRAPFAGGTFDLRAAPEAAAALRDAGFDLVAVENNHALDGGAAGRAESRATLRASGVHPLDGRTWRVTVRGTRLAWIALFDRGGGLDLAAVRRARRGADRLIVAVHWGAEYSGVTDRQRALARDLVGAGADVVAGYGPHVLQPAERIGDALVLYSLGNFAFDGVMPSTREGALVEVDFAARRPAACARPTRTSRGRVLRATGEAARRVLGTLGLPAC